jgi:hypothetical protein
MEKLPYTTFSQHMIDLVEDIQHLVRESTDISELSKNLEERVGDIERVQRAIIEDLRIMDPLLERLGTTLESRYIQGDTRREYFLLTKCNPCADSEDPHRQAQSKMIQTIALDNPKDCARIIAEEGREPVTYIHEVDLAEGTVMDELVRRGYKPNCEVCGSQFEITNTSNRIYPVAEEALSAIVQGVKSAGRYSAKLVDLMFYDMNDQRMKRRSIADRFRCALIVNYPNGMKEEEFRKRFRRQFDLWLPTTGLLEDQACYAMRRLIEREGFNVAWDKMQDGIARPNRRSGPKGRVEEFKMLQFDISFYGKAFEIQIKNRGTYQREQDRKSLIYHETYAEKERQLREAMYDQMPEARMVRDLLQRLFSTRHLGANQNGK